MLNTYQQQTIELAKTFLRDELTVSGIAFTASKSVIDYLFLNLAHKENEVFGCLFLNAQHQLICDKVVSEGTIDAAAVYPREVAKAALSVNAAAVIFYHNHPSGNPEPSHADRMITKTLVSALSLFDIRVLDHIVIGAEQNASFAERGLL